ncbi:MAG: cupredoxin family copper-binding protein [Thaumarchaeota archaeon]|nr:cupredoxin family copper-binding protein [Nitrososphaerota archaeon]
MAVNTLTPRSPEVLVPFSGLIYSALVLVYIMISTNFAPFSLIFVPFIALFLLGSFLVWRRSRIGYIISTALSVLFLLLEGSGIADAVSAVTIPGEFLSVVTAVPILFAVLVYSILGARVVWKKKADVVVPPKPRRMIPASSLVILLILGFIIGGITIGLVAAGTESRLLAASGGSNITIVQGAGNQNNGQFFAPSTYTVKVGAMVTWANHDGTAHTVTSKGSSLFDSGNIVTGGTFSYTFTQPGSYDYYCTIHPWMTGTIVVTAS